MTPDDFRQWEKLQLCYEGKLFDYEPIQTNRLLHNMNEENRRIKDNVADILRDIKRTTIGTIDVFHEKKERSSFRLSVKQNYRETKQLAKKLLKPKKVKLNQTIITLIEKSSIDKFKK